MHLAKEALNLVWLKRDLRTQDHLPLAEAEAAGIPYLVLYIFEPEFLAYADCAERHLVFQWQSLNDMQTQWASISRKPLLLYGDAVSIFTWLLETYAVQNIFSYQESGIAATFKRDKALALLFKQQGITWIEFQRNGVLRAISNRASWDKKWHAYMAEALVQNTYQASLVSNTSQALEAKNPFPIPDHLLALRFQTNAEMQTGGEQKAWQYFTSFLKERYRYYQAHISKPAQSRKSCSRLSPYIAWGNLSIKQVYQISLKQKALLQNKRAITAFLTRLKWHDHFVQKFEQRCSYEYKAINSAYEQLEAEGSDTMLQAWKAGKTGYPLVDANMRALHATGWINFRMRALLVSFLTHHLDMDWRKGVYHLAQLFLDYEPGIHYTQFQMQAGTTGVNTLRVYNPVKNALEHDSEGEFIRKWIPELAALPTHLLLQPWLMTELEAQMYQVELGKTYPFPIIELQGKNKAMVARLYAIKKTTEAQNEGKKIVSKLVRTRKGKSNDSKDKKPKA